MTDEALGDYVRWRGERSMEARDCWAAVQDRVRGEMTRGNYSIYFERSRGLALQAGETQGELVLVVGAPNTSAAEGLDTQFARLIRRALDALGRQTCGVRVVLLPTRTLPSGEDVVDVDGTDIPGPPPDAGSPSRTAVRVGRPDVRLVVTA